MKRSQRPPPKSRTVLAAALLGTLILSCDKEPTRPAPSTTPIVILKSDVGTEGELFGNIYSSGTTTKDAGYYVTLTPFNSSTAARLHYSNYTAWADTALGDVGGPRWMYDWSDPKAAGQCGNLFHYLNGLADTTYRLAEVHRPGPNQTPSGVERHCLRPGTYVFTLTHDGTVVKTFLVDYPAVTPAVRGQIGAKFVWNTTAGKNEVLDDLNYDDTTNVWQDLVVQVDLTSGAFTQTEVLDLQNAQANPTKDTFTNNASPTGSVSDHFRFSVARSTSTWNTDNQNQGVLLSQLFFNYGKQPTDHSGFYDPAGVNRPLLRIHTFGELQGSTTDTSAAEVMRPDQTPDSTRVAKRTLQITRIDPYACATFEGSTTWQGTDQYLSAGCSDRDPGVQYRWQTDANGSWTAYTSDTLLDFLGHATAGAHTVTLDADSAGNSGFSSTPVNVTTGQITFSGATYITSKATQIYRSNHYGIWYERYDPALHWYPASVNQQDTLAVIWPAGSYTDQLRQDSSTAGVLRRGRLSITVCNPSNGCQLPVVASPPASSSPTANIWNVFGAGPWLSWGSAASPRAVRLYDLWGMHDVPSSFADAGWVTDTGGAVSDAAGAWAVQWINRAQVSPNARVFQFAATGPLGVPMVFGMAVDPDIGANAADDVSGFDSTRGMVYATDANGAVGFLLRDSAQSVLYGVQQFSRGNPAPVMRADIWSSQRISGVHLIPGPRDVQFTVSTKPETGRVHYWFVVVRGTTLGSLQGTADSVVTALASATWQ